MASSAPSLVWHLRDQRRLCLVHYLQRASAMSGRRLVFPPRFQAEWNGDDRQCRDCGSPLHCENVTPRLLHWRRPGTPLNMLRVVGEGAEIVHAMHHDLARRHSGDRGIVGRIESDQDVGPAEAPEAGMSARW